MTFQIVTDADQIAPPSRAPQLLGEGVHGVLYFHAAGSPAKVQAAVSNEFAKVMPRDAKDLSDRIQKMIISLSGQHGWGQMDLSISRGLARDLLTDIAANGVPHRGPIIVDPIGRTPEFEEVNNEQILASRKERLIAANEDSDDVLIIMYGSGVNDFSWPRNNGIGNIRIMGVLLNRQLADMENNDEVAEYLAGGDKGWGAMMADEAAKRLREMKAWKELSGKQAAAAREADAADAQRKDSARTLAAAAIGAGAVGAAAKQGRAQPAGASNTGPAGSTTDAKAKSTPAKSASNSPTKDNNLVAGGGAAGVAAAAALPTGELNPSDAESMRQQAQLIIDKFSDVLQQTYDPGMRLFLQSLISLASGLPTNSDAAKPTFAEFSRLANTLADFQQRLAQVGDPRFSSDDDAPGREVNPRSNDPASAQIETSYIPGLGGAVSMGGPSQPTQDAINEAGEYRDQRLALQQSRQRDALATESAREAAQLALREQVDNKAAVLRERQREVASAPSSSPSDANLAAAAPAADDLVISTPSPTPGATAVTAAAVAAVSEATSAPYGVAQAEVEQPSLQATIPQAIAETPENEGVSSPERQIELAKREEEAPLRRYEALEAQERETYREAEAAPNSAATSANINSLSNRIAPLVAAMEIDPQQEPGIGQTRTQIDLMNQNMAGGFDTSAPRNSDADFEQDSDDPTEEFPKNAKESAQMLRDGMSSSPNLSAEAENRVRAISESTNDTPPPNTRGDNPPGPQVEGAYDDAPDNRYDNVGDRPRRAPAQDEQSEAGIQNSPPQPERPASAGDVREDPDLEPNLGRTTTQVDLNSQARAGAIDGVPQTAREDSHDSVALSRMAEKTGEALDENRENFVEGMNEVVAAHSEDPSPEANGQEFHPAMIPRPIADVETQEAGAEMTPAQKTEADNEWEVSAETLRNEDEKEVRREKEEKRLVAEQENRPAPDDLPKPEPE